MAIPAMAQNEDKLTKEQREREELAKLISNLFSSSDSVAEGTCGNPCPRVDSSGSGGIGGCSWRLEGGGCISLPRPSLDFNQSGNVVVEIIVDRQGYVISVRISDKGTTITDSEILKSALQAAKKAKFTPGEGNRRGYITYQFRLM